MNEDLSKALGLLQQKKNTSFFYGFLPEKTSEFYDDVSGFDLDEKIKDSTSSNYKVSNPKDTSKVDKFRQGVEITRPKYYATALEQGAFKIHSGEPGSLYGKYNFGYQKNFRNENEFVDIEKFDAVRFLQSDGNYTYPLIIGDNTDVETYDFNGVIEPLAIRPVISFYSIDVPFESHSVWANLEDGNMNISRSYSRIVSVYERDVTNCIEPWLDMADMVGLVVKIPSTGYFNQDKNFLLPFNDVRDRIELSKNLDEDMRNALLDAIGDTDNYVPDGYISAACGWMYDDVTVKGADSLAFAGLGY